MPWSLRYPRPLDRHVCFHGPGRLVDAADHQLRPLDFDHSRGPPDWEPAMPDTTLMIAAFTAVSRLILLAYVLLGRARTASPPGWSRSRATAAAGAFSLPRRARRPPGRLACSRPAGPRGKSSVKNAERHSRPAHPGGALSPGRPRVFLYPPRGFLLAAPMAIGWMADRTGLTGRVTASSLAASRGSPAARAELLVGPRQAGPADRDRRALPMPSMSWWSAWKGA